MPVTFGSVGDIIAVALLIKDLIKCLDDSRGSSAEYQAVIRELWSLEHALLEVELLFLSSHDSNGANALQETALRIAEQCDSCIRAFRERVKKYKDSLQPGNSGGFVKTATRKVPWNTSEKEPLAKFRAEIMAHCLSINMLISSAGVKSIRISDENIQRAFKKVKTDQDHLSATQEALLMDIKDSLADNRKETQAAKSEVQVVRHGMDFVRNLGAELLHLMKMIWATNIRTHKAIVTLQSRLPSQLERCWTQEPVILKDPLGRVTPVHLEFIETWEAFQSMLEVRFRQMPGHSKVQRNEYALEANRLNQEIDNSLAFRRWFRPGQEVDMSMVFNSSTGLTTSCPGCGLVALGPVDSKMKCQDCGMWYQHIEVEQEVDIQPQTVEMTKVKHCPGKRKRQEDLDDDDDPSQFCRVRLRYWRQSKLSVPTFESLGRLHEEDTRTREKISNWRRRALTAKLTKTNTFQAADPPEPAEPAEPVGHHRRYNQDLTDADLELLENFTFEQFLREGAFNFDDREQEAASELV